MGDAHGLAQGEALVREAWYDSLDELIAIINGAEDPRARIEAAGVVLEYTSKFGIGLNEPYIPDTRPPRSGGEEEDGEDD